jgi:type IV secretion system protein VirD4
VIPTLLGWDQSVIVYDLKGENWALTSGYRSKTLGQSCLKFSPLEKETAHFNPLSVLRFGTTHEVGDARKLSEMLLDTGAKLDDDYFLKQAITLGAALILHLFYEAREKSYAQPTPANLLDIATDAENGLKKVMKALQTYAHRSPALHALNPGDPKHQPFPGVRDHTLSTHPTIASTMSAMLLKGEKEFGSIIGSLTDPLQVYADPLVRDAVAYSDFSILNLVGIPTENGPAIDRPISLYLVIPFPDQIRLKPLVRLFFSMAVYRLTEHMDFDKAKTVKNPFRLLFLIDEFPSLGKMEIFETAMAVMGGFGLKAYLITQDFEQLYKAYGQNETIVSNCHVRIVYAPNNQKTAQLISEMTGKRTIRHATVSYSGARTSSAQNQMSTSVQLVERQLMTADEISKLRKPTKLNPGQPDEKIVGPGDMLIFVSGERPIYGVQILFFLDKEFTLRSKISPPLADSTSLYKAPTEPERPRSMHLLPAPAESQGDSIVSLEQNPHLTEITNKKRKEADDTQAPKLAQTRVVPVDDTIITETAAQFERDSQQEREDEEDYEQDEHDTFDAPPEELAVTPTANFTQENAK